MRSPRTTACTAEGASTDAPAKVQEGEDFGRLHTMHDWLLYLHCCFTNSSHLSSAENRAVKKNQFSLLNASHIVHILCLISLHMIYKVRILGF